MFDDIVFSLSGRDRQAKTQIIFLQTISAFLGFFKRPQPFAAAAFAFVLFAVCSPRFLVTTISAAGPALPHMLWRNAAPRIATVAQQLS